MADSSKTKSFLVDITGYRKLSSVSFRENLPQSRVLNTMMTTCLKPFRGDFEDFFPILADRKAEQPVSSKLYMILVYWTDHLREDITNENCRA